jgi:outer membrane protein OmpA-like peptidoglycan-associated protein
MGQERRSSAPMMVALMLACCLTASTALAEESEAQAGPEQQLRAAEIELEIMRNQVMEALAARAKAEAALEMLRRDHEALRADQQTAERRVLDLGTELDLAKGEIAKLGTEVERLSEERASLQPAAIGSGPADSAAASRPGPLLSTTPNLAPDEFQVGEVHFNPGSADLTPGGERKTLEAAERIKTMEIAEVRVVGYTDTMGEAGLNQHLSLERAGSIADLLASVGVSREMIEIDGSGEEGVPVPTDDQIAEPLNRCAGIYVVMASPK